MLLLNKTVFITGCNGGIGKVLCKKVLYNGANIINNMWIVIGTWLCANIMGLNKNTDS